MTKLVKIDICIIYYTARIVDQADWTFSCTLVDISVHSSGPLVDLSLSRGAEKPPPPPAMALIIMNMNFNRRFVALYYTLDYTLLTLSACVEG